MNIQIINFETNKDHYQVTRLLKTTANNQIEYMPFYCYEYKEVDCYLLIAKLEENKLIDWCSEHNVPLCKVIVLCNKPLESLYCWVGINVFDHDVDFEKVCQWLMLLKEKNNDLNLFENCALKVGKIKKEHDYERCVQMILKQNPSLKKSEVCLFVKEKSPFEIHPNKNNKLQLKQYYIKGISETYDYLIVTK